MTSGSSSSNFFTAGGTLPANAPSYVKRLADDELFHYIMAGEFCYVLTSRQMGKSSLMTRTSKRLLDAGVKSASIDLTQTGTVESEDEWYKGVLTQIKRRLGLSLDPVIWWEARKGIPNIQKFIEFFEEILFEVKESVAIFIDEVDITLKLDFRDNFLSGIRAIFNARAENSNLRRITFVLLGVASPSDLIKDRNRTPFNIGQEILLKPFNRQDAIVLENGIEKTFPGFGKKILDRIFYWTNGHPYLTQKLCQSVVEHSYKQVGKREIDLLVDKLFVSAEASRESNLRFVRDNILNHPKQEQEEILKIYKALLRGKTVRENKNSLVQNQLKLSGLAMADHGYLVVSNKIYRNVFDKRWVNRNIAADRSRRSYRWATAILMTIVVFLASVIYYDAIALPKRAQSHIDNLAIYKDDRGIQHLADLFQMKPYIFPNEYEYKAKDTFFNTFGSWDEQKTLIEIVPDEPYPLPEDYKAVIHGLYTSLADVDNSGQTTKLLVVMYESLKEMGMQNEIICQEIGFWLEARKSSVENNLDDALAKYTAAINLNLQNPATLFERARINTRLGDYDSALRDYEQVIAIVPKSSIEPTEAPTPTTSSTPVKASLTGFTQIISPTISFETSVPVTPLTTSSISETSEVGHVTIQTSLTPTLTFELTSTPTFVPTVTPSITPIPELVQSKFLTLGQRIAAVRNDINQNADFYLYFFQFGQVSFPTLAANVPILIPTSSPTITPSPTLQTRSELLYYMIVLDASEKMKESFNGRSKWDAALESVNIIIEGLDANANYGLVVVGGSNTSTTLDPCREPSTATTPFISKENLQTRVGQLQPAGGGSLHTAFRVANNQLQSLPSGTIKTLIFITGSSDNCESRDEWNDLEKLIQLPNVAGLHSEILILEENTGLIIRSIAERISGISRNVNAQAPQDTAALQQSYRSVISNVTAYIENEVLASATQTSKTATAIFVSAIPPTRTPIPSPTATFVPSTPTVTPSVNLLSVDYLGTGEGCQVNITLQVSGSPATGNFHVWNAFYSPEGDVYATITLPIGNYNYQVGLGGNGNPEYYRHEVWFEYNGISSNRLSNLVCPGLTPFP
jgi:tetratricopeptide (TPR) repeat protein